MVLKSPQQDSNKRDPRTVLVIAVLVILAIMFIAQRNAALLGASTLMHTEEELETRLPDRLIVRETCTHSPDCKGPYSICNLEGYCEPLPDADGMCTQPLVLTYIGSNGRAKHTYCKQGCAVTPQGARCL